MIATERMARRIAPRLRRRVHAVVLLVAALALATGLMAASAAAATSTLSTPTAAGANAAIVPDDARESRWADEVVPQVVVGDAVWLHTPHRARVLALYARPAGDAK